MCGMPEGECDLRCTLVFALVLLRTRNREQRRYLLFLHPPQGVLSSLDLSLGCGSAFQHLLCFADKWVTMLFQPLLYKGNNKNVSSPLYPCLSYDGDRIKSSACRRGDLTGFDTPRLPNRLYSSLLVPAGFTSNEYNHAL